VVGRNPPGFSAVSAAAVPDSFSNLPTSGTAVSLLLHPPALVAPLRAGGARAPTTAPPDAPLDLDAPSRWQKTVLILG
jgi:hypothetical protein